MSNFFILLDLDGTIVDTDKLHYECYKKALRTDISWNYFEDIINNKSIYCMLEDCYIPKEEYENIRKKKFEYFSQIKDINYIPGADKLIEYFLDNSINFVIVTNSSLSFVRNLQEKLPLLKRINQWITREDYKEAKPSNECYKLAINKFYKGETIKIGVENTINGYKSIKLCVDKIYFITNKESINYDYISKEDITITNNLENILDYIKII